MTAMEETGRGQERTALLSVLAAVVLVTVKLATGLVTGSLGLIAEALHSGTDLVAALLTLFAVRVAVRPPDREHPYGHGKAEHLSALAEAAFLALASVFIAVQSGRRLMEGDAAGRVDAAWWALAVLVGVIAIDASRAWVSWQASKRYGSPALASNALHFAGDLVGSVSVLVGLLLVRAGYAQGDAIAGLVVAALVIAAAARLARTNVEVLMDRAPQAAAQAAREAIARDEPAVDLRRLRVREAAGAYFVDAVVGVPQEAVVGPAHAFADSLEAAVRRAPPRA
ncbi:MAG: cation diffusion facilitator family transporter, partial [Solirubrobacteraceae bacterium]